MRLFCKRGGDIVNIIPGRGAIVILDNGDIMESYRERFPGRFNLFTKALLGLVGIRL